MWRKTLAQIPTLFGRLVFLSSLRDGASGRYSYAPLACVMSSEDTDRTLCHSHHQVFQQWLCYSLADQLSDLDEYLSTGGGARHSLPYRNLAPPTARAVERQLYLTDLETLLELLRRDRDDVFATRTA